MHLTLKKEATRPPERNLLQQQVRFDAFLSEFNEERPHEAIGMKVPADLYATSLRPYLGLRKSIIPSTIATSSSPIADAPASIARRSTYRPFGWTETGIKGWKTAFGSSASCSMIGVYIDLNRERYKPSTIRSARDCHYVLGTNCYLCLRFGHWKDGCGAGFEPAASCYEHDELRAAPPRVMLSVRRVFFSDGPVELPGHFCLPFSSTMCSARGRGCSTPRYQVFWPLPKYLWFCLRKYL